MHQAPLQSTLISHAESSIDATFLRDSDEVTKALRHDEGFELEQLIRSGRTTSPTYNNSILSSPNARIFSERAGSALTEPSTIGSHYGPDNSPTSKGKAAVASASSLSVGNGSASETEVHALRNTTLVAMGDWTKDDPAFEAPLRDVNKIKQRGHSKQQKGKKPPVRFQSSSHSEPPRDLPGHGTIATTVPETSHIEPLCMEPPHVQDPRMDTSTNSGASIPNRSSPDSFQLRRRPTQYDDRMQLAEEGMAEPHEASQSRKLKRLTSTRKVVVTVLVMSIITTLAIAGFGAYHFGKEQFACTKGIIFATTVIVAMLTSSAMVVATCTLQNALLAGLLEMAIGFMLLVELKDFMLISHLPP